MFHHHHHHLCLAHRKSAVEQRPSPIVILYFTVAKNVNIIKYLIVYVSPCRHCGFQKRSIRQDCL